MIQRLRNFGLADTVELQMQVQAWVEARFRPGDSDVVMVNEIVCGQPGCPPLETVIALLPESRKPIKFKLYKALADVTEADVQKLGKPGWTLQSPEPPW
jgi:hypothetical protein